MPQHCYLFVIDGSKALRKAFTRVLGSAQTVQRCHCHEINKVCEKVPDDLAAQGKLFIKAANEPIWQERIARIKKLADCLERHFPGPTESLSHGLKERSNIERLELKELLFMFSWHDVKIFFVKMTSSGIFIQ